MSKAGIQSNRGDGYQTLVAFDWALTVLVNPDCQWLEVDSINLTVDDVVIGRADGTLICCQCKKNQKEHKAWSIADLSDELSKAIHFLTNSEGSEVRFYSRTSFGDLAALRDFSANYADKFSYQKGLMDEAEKGANKHKNTDEKLANLLLGMKTNLNTFQFLQHTKFEVSPDLDRMGDLLRERLSLLVSNELAAFNTLWTHLDHLGFRERADSGSSAPRHRLAKEYLKNLLSAAGSILAPPADIQQLRTSFKSTSAIGRSWCKDIGGEKISNPTVNLLIDAVKAKRHSILLTGSPGAGKTCVMLDLQDELEKLAQNGSLIPLFIQSREFADSASTQEREAQGLPEKWVEKAARLADEAHVVVVIDSLDVLSIAREHSVLTYFLTQIDRLLQIPNVTLVTACRDFDLHYDRRIAVRNWDIRFRCQPLNWDTEVTPLLAKLGIDSSVIDAATRALICNPRELALFVDLALRGGSSNVVTSQALAQRYLAAIVQGDLTLGDAAMQALEDIAAIMLQRRSMAVPQQRFSASEPIKRALLNNNVLHETGDGQLTFGHQTLLDILVISRAIRQGDTLNSFIQKLPPVPFIRPSIRSFVAQLATGDKYEFLKQIRTVLTGDNAFHVRRLVAETLAEQLPQDEFWPLIRDMYLQHREIFQVFYTQAVHLEWHYFWLQHLIPLLKSSSDIDGLTRHVHRIAQWKNDDAEGVVKFWTEMLAFNSVDKTRTAYTISLALTDIHEEYLAVSAPLVYKLLDFSRQQHSVIGGIIARCVISGDLDDRVLWDYIIGDICDEDLHEHDFANKLRSQSHNFGGSHETFLADRMRESAELLDLAVTSIEHWRSIRNSRPGATGLGVCKGFLKDTSFRKRHSQGALRFSGPICIVLDAIESAVLHHARTQSVWWQKNRERLCFNPENALRYFAILACTETPSANLDVVSTMLIDRRLLESDLSFELGALIRATFFHLESVVQDEVQSVVLQLYHELSTKLDDQNWIHQRQAQLILSIPCHLRIAEAQAVLNECEKTKWPLIQQPKILSEGGMVGAPFSCEVFLKLNDESVLCLLRHYDGYHRNSFDDFLVGGEREVGLQLNEAASRNPTRFLSLLTDHWEDIPTCFRDVLMCGVVKYLAHRYGHLEINDSWIPQEEPDAPRLAQRILDELQSHASHWLRNHEASKAINNCAYVATEQFDAMRIVSLAVGFLMLHEESAITGDSVSLLSHGINMSKGNAAEALIILANTLVEKDIPWPEPLSCALRMFAADEHPAVRALMLRRLPYLQGHHPEFGWELFGLAMNKADPSLWTIAEPCLYHAYHQSFEAVSPWLNRLYQDGRGKELETWGRISALAVLSKKMNISVLLGALISRASAEAWEGAAGVWTHVGNLKQHKELCLTGLNVGLSSENIHAHVVARKLTNIFREKNPPLLVPIELIRCYFSLMGANSNSHGADINGFAAWLNAISVNFPVYALEACESYFDFVQRKNISVYDLEKNLTQLLTRLFSQAEEQEESDSSAMLKRVVVLQDILLELGVNGVEAWLKEAERN